ncbi:hypothetical protein HYFRA_00014085 [Hymenoscyphus fraxineus]|uniref:Uncharacterized protein n=1 Tax=Hymenoscyphus fraxineus TaxID=746836 RepID=A0A9N9Q1M7_9HELO|nr:hypothetical protein HYFRA_00014085 [Hymenoscyphus fraxineus]
MNGDFKIKAVMQTVSMGKHWAATQWNGLGVLGGKQPNAMVHPMYRCDDRTAFLAYGNAVDETRALSVALYTTWLMMLPNSFEATVIVRLATTQVINYMWLSESILVGPKFGGLTLPVVDVMLLSKSDKRNICMNAVAHEDPIASREPDAGSIY